MDAAALDELLGGSARLPGLDGIDTVAHSIEPLLEMVACTW